MIPPKIVIGIGNRFRRDDGSALRVLDALAGRIPAATVVLESDGEPARLIDAWADAPIAVVVETVRRGQPPGSIAGIEWDDQVAPAAGSDHGSHSLGILEAIALGRAVGRMPRRLRIVGIEPEDLAWGEGLTDAVAASIDAAAELVIDYLRMDGGDPPVSI
ncbi:MAG: hydrogenase maturation protease [Candidatus Dormibacteria bacterium]